MDLSLSIENLRNVGTRNLSRLHRLGIKTVKDLLWHFPLRYDDYTETSSVNNIEPGEKVNIQGQILKISTKRIFPRRMTITNAIIGDSSGAIKVVWFNQPYIENQLTEGSYVSIAGKAKLDKHGLYISSPTYEKISPGDPSIDRVDDSSFEKKSPYNDLHHTQGLVPVYPETEGITSKYLRFLLKPILKEFSADDPLPDSIRKRHGLLDISSAIKTIHHPSSTSDAVKAKERFAFEDLLLFQIKALLERRKAHQLKSVAVPFDRDYIIKFIESLPFELTKDQKIAAWEIIKDLDRSYPMNRLLEGDVGSGKTVVALIGAIQIAQTGNQTVFLAPTEVLAQQHYQTILSLVRSTGIHVGLLTASQSIYDGIAIKKNELKKEVAFGSVQILIGTHAIIQKDVSFKSLVLVVIDEQHRFGIQQRAKLIKQDQALVPHLLSMTATPIPRTLALTIYGDLDISLIREKPKNRQKIVTKIVTPSKLGETYDFIRSEVKSGRQVFVVCPRIELADPQESIKASEKRLKMNILWAEVKAVQEEFKKLSDEIFPDLKVAMLHGKLKPKEKESLMSKFKNGDYDILVSTSVIEVGVDVPNATVMFIQSAERFGLAQLHQFRGRVGRDQHQSYCILATSSDNQQANQRLKALVECDDGFLLAEKDMTIRGPGEFFGVKQSGLPDLAMASLANMDLIKKARTEARTLLKEDPNLKKFPLLSKRLAEFQRMIHFE